MLDGILAGSDHRSREKKAESVDPGWDAGARSRSDGEQTERRIVGIHGGGEFEDVGAVQSEACEIPDVLRLQSYGDGRGGRQQIAWSEGHGRTGYRDRAEDREGARGLYGQREATIRERTGIEKLIEIDRNGRIIGDADIAVGGTGGDHL